MAAATQPNLLDFLRERTAQARETGAAYAATSVPGNDSMLVYLAQAAREAREAGDRMLVHVGASANMDQSAISRFEQASAWPRDPDKIIAAYADDLDITPLDIWKAALVLWAQASTGPSAGAESPVLPAELGRRIQDRQTKSKTRPQHRSDRDKAVRTGSDG